MESCSGCFSAYQRKARKRPKKGACASEAEKQWFKDADSFRRLAKSHEDEGKPGAAKEAWDRGLDAVRKGLALAQANKNESYIRLFRQVLPEFEKGVVCNARNILEPPKLGNAVPVSEATAKEGGRDMLAQALARAEFYKLRAMSSESSSDFQEARQLYGEGAKALQQLLDSDVRGCSLQYIRETEKAVASLREREAACLEKKLASLPLTWAPMSGTFSVVKITDGDLLDSLRACMQTKSEWLGQGRDVKQPQGAPYKLVLSQAWRVQNTYLFNKYKAERMKMQDDITSRNHSASPFRNRLEKHASAILGNLNIEVNEVLLLHGTSPDAMSSIMTDGMNERHSSRPAFGFGTYLCDDAGKADQYVRKAEPSHLDEPWATLLYGSSASRPAGYVDHFYMFVCRAALGVHVRTLDSEYAIGHGGHVWSELTGKAKKRELNYHPTVTPRLRYHSAIVEITDGDTDTNLFALYRHQRVYRYREIVVPHSERIYPEYVLAYRRERC